MVHSGPEELTPAVLDREVSFAAASLALALLNESAWNYLRGLWEHHAELGPRIRDLCVDLLQGSEDNPFALALLADLLEAEGTPASLARAAALIDRLVAVDQIRAKAWKKRRAALPASF